MNAVFAINCNTMDNFGFLETLNNQFLMTAEEQRSRE